MARHDLDLIIWISYGALCFPVLIFGKFVFSKLTNKSFIITGSNITDLVIVTLVITTRCITFYYDNKELSESLFNETEDNLVHVKFMGNMIDDIKEDRFHFDYLMASFTAVLWFRVIVMLRLTEQFGPLTTMIANMVVIVIKFLIIYIVGIITFSSVATLTLS